MSETLTQDLSDASAGEMVSALAAGRASALELTEAAIARIEARDRPINAVVVRDFDRARVAARAADAALARGERRPLLGVPMTVKESNNVAGLPTTWGFEAAKGWMASEDSVGVARLKAAGAVILGKTNVPVGLADWQTVNPIYGRTHNPHDLSRSPGGSSGGAAAAVAAGMTPLELGSDIGGSIRVPAAFCGIYGHKPTYGIIPQRGHAPAGLAGGDMALAVLGPLARTAADLDLALGVLAGPTEDEAAAWSLNLPPPRHGRLADYRVLVLDSHPLGATDHEIVSALDDLASRLADLGASVARRSDLLPDFAKSQEIFGGLLGAALSRGGPQPSQISAHAFMDLADAQLAVRFQWGEVFKAFDVVVAPAIGTLPFPDIDAPWAERVISINGRDEPYGSLTAWPGLAILGHLPATAAPIGLSAAGLPIGVQIIGPYLEDRTTIAFAGLLEPEFGGFRAP